MFTRVRLIGGLGALTAAVVVVGTVGWQGIPSADRRRRGPAAIDRGAHVHHDEEPDRGDHRPQPV